MSKVQLVTNKLHYKLLALTLALAFCLSGSISVFAADTATTTAMTTGFTAIKDDAVAAIAAIAPIGLGIAGVFLAWKFGLKFFKKLTNQ